MKPIRILASLSLFASAAAFAQVYEPRPSYDGTLTRSELRECIYRDESLALRLERVDREKAEIDDDTDAIARAGARLADELRGLDSSNLGAVAAYNARSAAHNRRVHDHNRRVDELNQRTALVNGDSARLDSLCARAYRPSDRDAIMMERARIR